MILPWLMGKNLYAIVGLIALGGAIVSGLYIKGYRDAQRKWALEMADRNKELAALSGKDEAEIAAEDKAAKATDAAVSGAISQVCVITPETARLMASIR